MFVTRNIYKFKWMKIKLNAVIQIPSNAIMSKQNGYLIKAES